MEQQITALLQQLTVNQRELQEAVRQQGVALQQSLEQQAKAFSGLEESRKTIADPKHLGKLNNFTGKESDWGNWSFQFQTWVSSIYPDGQRILDWARDRRDDPITNETIQTTQRDFPASNVQKISDQLFVTLSSLMPVSSECISIVKNSTKNVGLDAWRRLCKRYDPNNPQVNMHLLKTILHPTKVSLHQLQMNIESWEERYRVYTEKTKESLSDPMQRMCLQSMCPDLLGSHLDMHIARLDTYLKMKTEILAYVEATQSRERNGASPMDVDMASMWPKGKSKGKGKGKKGKGKGKSEESGKGRVSFDGNCNYCWKYGHRASECWAKAASKGDQSSKGKGKGKDFKGKGKGKKGKIGSLEEQHWPGEQEYTQGAEQSPNSGSWEQQHYTQAMSGEHPHPTGNMGSLFGLSELIEHEIPKNPGIRSVQFSALSLIQKQLREMRERGVPENEIQPLKDIEMRLKAEMKQVKKMSARLRRDLEAGKPAYLAKIKDKRRERAAAHRKSKTSERARHRIDMDNKWHEVYDNPKSEIQPSDFVNRTRELPGVEDDIVHEAEIERRPLSQPELKAYLTEQSRTDQHHRARMWSKPRWAKHKSSQQKQRKREKQRSKRREKRKADRYCIDWYRRGACKKGDQCEFKHAQAEEEIPNKTAKEITNMKTPQEVPEHDLMCTLCVAGGSANTKVNNLVCSYTNADTEYERVDLIVDSGASTSAIPNSYAKCVPLERDSQGKYLSASGHVIEAKGTKSPMCHFQNGESGKLKFKIMEPEVHRGMISVAECVRAGNKVVFDKGDSYIYNHETKTYKRIYLHNGVYVLPIWFEKGNTSDKNTSEPLSGF